MTVLTKLLNSSIKSEKDLSDYLEGYGIETYSWGKKGKNSLSNLYNEVVNGETELFIDNNKIKRKIRNVVIYIYYEIKTDYGHTLLNLREVARINKNENEKFVSENIIKRGFNGSIASKLKIDEDIEKAAYDCLKRKLEINTSTGIQNLRHFSQDSSTAATSYKTLETEYETFEYDLYLQNLHYKPNGYCYESIDKNSLTLLEWRIL